MCHFHGLLCPYFNVDRVETEAEFHEFSIHFIVLYCSWGEEGAGASHRSCQTRREGASHKILRSSSTEQAAPWEASEASVTAVPLTLGSGAVNSPAALTRWTVEDCESFCSVSTIGRSSATPLIRSLHRLRRMNWHKTCQLLLSVPGLLLHCNLSLVHLIGWHHEHFRQL